MIDVAVQFLADEVNLHLLRRRGPAGTDQKKLRMGVGPLVDDAGKWALPEGELRLSLVGIEEERSLRSQVPERAYIDGSHVVLQPELKLNLHLVVAARYKEYGDSLQMMSHVLTFFQAHPTFERDEYPGLDRGIARLSVDLLSYGPEQLNQLWAYIGARYLPSAVYRVRLVTLQDVEPREIGTPITTITAHSRATAELP